MRLSPFMGNWIRIFFPPMICSLLYAKAFSINLLIILISSGSLQCNCRVLKSVNSSFAGMYARIRQSDFTMWHSYVPQHLVLLPLLLRILFCHTCGMENLLLLLYGLVYGGTVI